jgi:hypothetical protein
VDEDAGPDDCVGDDVDLLLQAVAEVARTTAASVAPTAAIVWSFIVVIPSADESACPNRCRCRLSDPCNVVQQIAQPTTIEEHGPLVKWVLVARWLT